MNTTTDNSAASGQQQPRRLARVKRLVAVLAVLLSAAALLIGAAGTASATAVVWPDLGGPHDQIVTCNHYNRQIVVNPLAGPMYGYHNGQVVKAEFFVRDVNATTWTSFTNILAARVPATYIANPILGATGGEYDWQYLPSSLGTFTVTGRPGHNYVVYVNYTYYSEARQVVRTDMHWTSVYSGGFWGVSGTTWIPNSSTVSCGT